MLNRTMARQVLLFICLLSLSSAHGQVSYSVPEEMPPGSLVGNIAQDFGLDIKRLKSRNARVYTGDSAEYVVLNRERGVLLMKERIDRETLCEQTAPCALHFKITLDNPIEMFGVTIEITDINDNAPGFKNNHKRIEISETAVVGSKFVLEKAMDADIGTNSLQKYTLTPTDHFKLKLDSQSDKSKKVEMVLQKPLDREKQENITLLLTAIDGGEPPMSGTLQIHVTVLDVNDNAPVFAKPVYKAAITENSAKGTFLTRVSASDMDRGPNGHFSYFISNTDSVSEMFRINENGDVFLIGQTDYEKARNYQIDIEAIDVGGLSDSTKIIVDVIDINDNIPLINVISMSNSLPENSPPNTVIAMISVNDKDSGENGKVTCNIDENVPCAIKSTGSGFYSIVTDSELDREKEHLYNITVACVDEGTPSLSACVSLSLQIVDVNDNAPVYEQSTYEASIIENNKAGLSVLTVKARDADSDQNAHVSYILEKSLVNGIPIFSYVSIDADTGIIQTLRTFDYEQIKEFQFSVKAQDGGSPPLSSNVTVKIVIHDQNDNAPQVLYPVQTGGSLVAEIVPRSADLGYIVTKVVAVDVDSGQNAWLSYKLQKVTDRPLFEVDLHNGEIRTVRQVTDKDSVKQKLIVVVKDNGQPSRSATVNINVAVADGFPEVLLEFTDLTHDKEYDDNLTLYLVLALALVSFLFIVSIIVILSVKCYRWRRERMLYKSGATLPVIPYYPPLYADVGTMGTSQHIYNYDVCRTTDYRKSRPFNQSIINFDTEGTQTLTYSSMEKPNVSCSDDQVRFMRYVLS